MKCYICPYAVYGTTYPTGKYWIVGCALFYIKYNFYNGNEECSLTYNEICKIDKLTQDINFPKFSTTPIDLWEKEDIGGLIKILALTGKEEVERMNEYIKELKEKGR